MELDENKHFENNLLSPETVLSNIPGLWHNPLTGVTWYFYHAAAINKIARLRVRQKNAADPVFFEYFISREKGICIININGNPHPLISFSERQFTFKSNEHETITLYRA